LLAILSEFRSATGFGVDIATDAVITARRNAGALGFAERAHFLAGDWAAAVSGEFDVVVSNPPYIARDMLADLPPEVGRHDPRRALDGGPDGLCAFRRLAAHLPRILAPGSLFACEVGFDQAPAVAAILQGVGLALDGWEFDLAGVARCVIARPTTPAG